VPLNRCLRFAVVKLLETYQAMRNRRGAREMVSRLAIANSYFANIPLDPTMAFMADRQVYDVSALPYNKPSYRIAIPVAKLVALNKGIVVREQDGDVVLPSVLVSMETVFESYIRSVLRTAMTTDKSLLVFDGNQGQPLGAARPLFDGSESAGKTNQVNPDVVIWRGTPANNAPELVIDAKYKVVSKPDRSDMEQVLVYGLAYKCKRVCLAYPRRGPTEPAVQHVGSVGGIHLFMMRFNLGADDLPEEERIFVQATEELLRSEAS
jgi:5-methylcytosine-specific restriction enzyme subunit McrC